jgi:hypothetical protein
VKAVELVRRGELRAAKAEFERAFAESPHPSVLYNLARLCLELGERDEARAHARRFLELSDSETPKEQRDAVAAMLDQLGAGGASPKRDREPASKPAPAEQIVPHHVEASAPERPGRRPSQSDSPCLGCLPKTRVDSLVADERGRTAGIALGATGAALLATGVGVLVWNEGKARAAERQRRALAENRPPGDIQSENDLLTVLSYERGVSENRAAFRSVEQFDVVGWSLVGVGAAMLGTGAVLVLTHAGESKATVALRGDELTLSMRF